MEPLKTLRAGTVARYCPVDGCPWTSVPRPVDAVVEVQLAPPTAGYRAGSPRRRRMADAAVRDAFFREFREAEEELLEHLRSHDPADFLRTIRRLRADLEAT